MHAANGIDDDFHLTLPPAVESALACQELAAADEALALLRNQTTLAFQPYLAAQAQRLEALLLVARTTGDVNADVAADVAVEANLDIAAAQLSAAADELGAFGAPYWQARTQLDLAQLLIGRGGDRAAEGEIAAKQALSTFEALGTPLWAARARRLIAGG